MKTFPLNSRIWAGSAFLLVAGLLLCILMPTPALASHGNDDFPDWNAGLLTTDGSGHANFFRVQHTAPPYGITLTDANPIFNRSAVNETNYSDPTNGGSTGANYIFSDATGAYGLAYGSCTDGTYLLTVFDQYSTKTVKWQNEITVSGGCTVITPESLVDPCADGIMNGDETGIDVGGACAVVNINTPVDTTTVSDFQNFSVSYSGVDVEGFHQIWVHWSDSSSLMTTCVDGVMAGSDYYGAGYVSPSSYSTCVNSLPKIKIEQNSISFSRGIHSYTGSVPKTQALVDGKTYYAQAFVVDETSGFLYVVKSSVISFTMSGGVPVVQGSGTVSNTAGDGTITGTGTHFSSTLKIGDILTVGGQDCRVLSIVSDTELECTPLTSAHTTQSYTQNSVPSQGIDYEECSSFDIACGLKNVFKWLFTVSPATLNQFSNLSLSTKTPFSYLYDVGTIFNELFANSGSMSYAVSASTPIGTINFISASAISAVPYASTIKTILGYMLYFFTAMTIYRLLLRVHNK